MDETSDDGRRKLLTANPSKITERDGVDRPKLVDRGGDTCVERAQHRRNLGGSQWFFFRPERRELRLSQRLATRIREQPIDHARHVTDMKRRRRNTAGASIPLLFSESLDELMDALLNLQQYVGDRLQRGGDTGNWSTLPPFGFSHFVSRGVFRG
jgi:hypothetical protein